MEPSEEGPLPLGIRPFKPGGRERSSPLSHGPKRNGGRTPCHQKKKSPLLKPVVVGDPAGLYFSNVVS